MELALSEHLQEDILGENVLQQHLPHVGGGHGGANALLAQFEEPGRGGLIAGVGRFGVGDGLAQIVNDGGQIGLELPLRLAKLLDLREFVVQKHADEAVQLAGAGHVGPHGLLPVLEQDGGLGIFENDIALGIASVELTLNLGVQVVAAVLGLPVAPGHAQGVLHRAVGPVAWRGVQLVNQGQLFAVFAAVGIQTNSKGAPDALLVVRAAELYQPLLVGLVPFYVGVGRHIENIHHRARRGRSLTGDRP